MAVIGNYQRRAGRHKPDIAAHDGKRRGSEKNLYEKARFTPFLRETPSFGPVLLIGRIKEGSPKQVVAPKSRERWERQLVASERQVL